MKPGDKVQLKSGGPAMTYEGPGSFTTQSVRCVYFDRDEDFQSVTVDEQSLKPYESKDSNEWKLK